MENLPHSQTFATGRLVLKSPCSVGQDAFTPQGERNKFCSQCNKVVHNLIGKSEAEIKALFAANSGEVCGTIRASRPVHRPETKLAQPLRKPSYFKHLAATASLLLLTQVPSFAAPTAKAPSTWIVPDNNPPADPTVPTNKTNTMITGVIMNQDSTPLPFDFEVAIYSNKVFITKTTAHHGLFKVDLQGKLAPNAVIGLIIKADSGKDPISNEKVEHGAAQRVITLHDAQNVALVMEYFFDYGPVDGGLGWEDFNDDPQPTADADN